jgi:hypothetical protein
MARGTVIPLKPRAERASVVVRGEAAERTAPPRRVTRRRPPPAYVQIPAPSRRDAKAAARVLAWLAARMR